MVKEVMILSDSNPEELTKRINFFLAEKRKSNLFFRIEDIKFVMSRRKLDTMYSAMILIG